jgi:hypothetical protein
LPDTRTAFSSTFFAWAPPGRPHRALAKIDPLCRLVATPPAFTTLPVSFKKERARVRPVVRDVRAVSPAREICGNENKHLISDLRNAILTQCNIACSPQESDRVNSRELRGVHRKLSRVCSGPHFIGIPLASSTARVTLHCAERVTRTSLPRLSRCARRLILCSQRFCNQV